MSQPTKRGKAEKGPREAFVSIPPPNLLVATFLLEGTTLYVQNRFTKKAREQMEENQREGARGKSKRKREPRNFEGEFEEAMHCSTQGWYGIPASAFRAAGISACRLVDFKMTIAKIAFFILADGVDAVDSQPLVKIIEGKPEQRGPEPLPNSTGVMDLRVRAQWQPGWRVKLRIQYDADRFSLSDIANLVHRMGSQIGVGAGRPDSKDSPGVGWGLFRTVGKE